MMLTKSLDQLRKMSRLRPPGYMDDVLSHATLITPTQYVISDEDFLVLRRKYDPHHGRQVMEVEGPKLWAQLHARAGEYRGDAAAEAAWLERFAAQLPCGECRDHWAQLVSRMPPDLVDAAAYSRWTVAAHNIVNRRLGKPEWAGVTGQETPQFFLRQRPSLA